MVKNMMETESMEQVKTVIVNWRRFMDKLELWDRKIRLIVQIKFFKAVACIVVSFTTDLTSNFVGPAMLPLTPVSLPLLLDFHLRCLMITNVTR